MVPDGDCVKLGDIRASSWGSAQHPYQKMKKLNLFTRVLCCYFAVFLALPMSVFADLTLNPPTFPSTNTVRVTLNGAQSTNAHVILWTPELTPNIFSWYHLTTGTVGQTTFDFTITTNQANFFAAAVAPVMTPVVATPTFSVAGGSYGLPTNVVITCATAGALIYYTTNGSTPTVLDNFISSGDSVYIDRITTLKAKAFESGYDPSSVATASYSINSGPTVLAGNQQTIATSSLTLGGHVTDDGLYGGGTKFTNWAKISGPSTVSFDNATLTNATATFGSDGIYILELSASDGQYTNSSQVTIAVNPTISVSITSPSDASSYTIPTNLLVQATASCGSGSVTQLLFYANGTFIGEGTGSPLSFNWKNVPAGSIALTAVAVTDDTNNYSLASAPVNITVDWPTNIGQVTLASTELQIPAVGLPITVNRQYDSRLGVQGSFGVNARLDYEAVKIEKNTDLAYGWEGKTAGFVFSVLETTQHILTVSLSETEKYYFRAIAVFKPNDSLTYNGFQPPRYSTGVRGRIIFQALGGTGKLDLDNPSNMGYDDGFLGWNHAAIRLQQGGGGSDYEPGFDKYTFTSADGTKYRFNSAGGLGSKTDRNGNYLTFSDGGISHSSGKQVTFTRNPTNNYITEIYDPIALDILGSPVMKYDYDDSGNLTNVARLIQRSPAVYENTAYAYTNTTFTNNITSITDPRGIVSARYEYDTSGRLSAQYDGFGRATTFYYDLVNRRQIVTDRLGNTTIKSFTDSGKVASIRDAKGALTTFDYDEQGRKISETNPSGETTTFAYDQNDQLIGTTNELNQSISTTYNSIGLPVATTDSRGNSTYFEYDPNGNLIGVTNALGVINAYAYDAQGNRIGETNALGLPEQVGVVNEYDSFGYLTNVTVFDSQSSIVSSVGYGYDLNGNRVSETKSRTIPGLGIQSSVTQWGYDAANRVTVRIDALNNTNYTSYNGIGKLAFSVDALGRTNFSYYDANGALTNKTFPDGLTERVSYDAEGRRVEFIDRAGRTNSYSYDALGQLTRTTYPDGTYTANFYNSAGRLTSVGQGALQQSFSPPPAELTLKYAYDAAGRPTAMTNALGQVTSFAYDENGNQTNIIDALSNATGTEYDALNRQTRKIYADGSSDSIQYDGLNRKTLVVNQSGITNAFLYDALSRLVVVTNALGTTNEMVTRYTYDEVGNLLEEIDALNRTNSFRYDDLGRKIQQTMPGGQTATMGYDAVGNVIRITNFNSVVITNQYDAMDQLTNRSAAGGYKIVLKYSATGLRTNMIDASGTNSYAYDAFDRLLTRTTPQGTLSYTYNEYGNLGTVQSSTANGTRVNYYYDVLNRPTNIVDRFGNSTFYAYDAAGNLQTSRYANNVTNLYSYDSLNRLTNIAAKASSGTLAAFGYNLESSGNRTRLVEALNGINRTNSWGYDLLYRLTTETITASSGPTGGITYKYDAVGNRTNRSSSVSGVGALGLTLNSNDQLTSDGYDANGNTTNSASISYKYDAENHLTNYNNGAAVYVYDGDGNRVRKTVGGVTTYYLIDDHNLTGQPQVVEELSVVGSTPDKVYTFGLSLISQRQSSGTTSFYGYDANGNVRFLTGTNGAISDTYVYDSGGILISSSGSTANSHRFAGEYYDSDLGMYYFRARYLNANTGRFWNRDSFGGDHENPLSLNKYLYAQANSINNTDPSGLDIGATLSVMYSFSLLAQVGSPVAANVQRQVQQTVRRISGNRPYSQDFWTAYLNYDAYTQPNVWYTVGGGLGQSFGPTKDNPNGQNSCATRVSRGLNYGGAPIPSGTPEAWGRNFSDKKFNGVKGDDKYYITSAGSMQKYLNRVWGQPDIKIKTVDELKAYVASLGDNQCAIFATKGPRGQGHTGVLKIGYQDWYVEGELPVDVWLLPVK